MGKVELKDIHLTNLLKISNPLGDIMHIMKNTDKGFVNFGEAYFSWINKNAKKGWKMHKKMTLNLCVPLGSVKFVFKTEKDSISRVETIGENDYSRITVPPKIWFAMIGIANPKSLIINIADIKHDINEVISKSEKEFGEIMEC